MVFCFSNHIYEGGWIELLFWGKSVIYVCVFNTARAIKTYNNVSKWIVQICAPSDVTIDNGRNLTYFILDPPLNELYMYTHVYYFPPV